MSKCNYIVFSFLKTNKNTLVNFFFLSGLKNKYQDNYRMHI